MGAFVHLVNMPVLFTSTALVPDRQMPDWLSRISSLNPMTITVDAWRGALLFGDTPSFGAHVAPLLLLAALLYAVARLQMGAVARLY